LLALTTFGLSFGRNTLGPLQEALRLSLSLSDDEIALLQGTALALPMGLASIPFGYLADRGSRARLLMLSAAANLLGTLITAVAPNFFVLFCGRCLVGLAIAGMGPAALSFISDLFSPAQRGRATMGMLVGSVAGSSAVFALGGFLIARTGGPDGWRSVMLWLAGPLVLALCLSLLLREPPRGSTNGTERSGRAALSELWRHRSVITPLLVGFVVVNIGDVAALVWAAPTFSRAFAVAPADIGSLMAALLLAAGLLGPVAGGLLSDLCQRFGGPPRTMALLMACAIVSIPAGVFAMAPNVGASFILLFVFMTLGYAISTITITLSIIVIPNELRGVCTALFNMAGGVLGIAAAPLAVSLLSRIMGGPEMIGHALAVTGVATAVMGTIAFALGRLALVKTSPARMSEGHR
jgi:MFS family permease